MEYYTVKMIQLQIYTTQNQKNGQISSILFEGINFKGKINLIIRTVVTLRGGAHRASEITVIFLNWVLRTLVFAVLFTLYKFCNFFFIYANLILEFVKINHIGNTEYLELNIESI